MISCGARIVLDIVGWDYGTEIDSDELHDALTNVADAYSIGAWKRHLNIILNTEANVEEIVHGMDGNWKKQSRHIAYEVFRRDLHSRVKDCLKGLLWLDEQLQEYPVSDSTQLWLGLEGPVFVVNPERLTGAMQFISTSVELCRIISGSGASIIFEGPQGIAEVDDLYQMVYGGLPTVRPRRVYLQYPHRDEGKDHVMDIVLSLFDDGALHFEKDTNGEKYQALLSCMSQR